MKINNLNVVDAKKTITILVGKTDIRNAKVKDPANCAAALACKRQLHSTDVRVHVGRTYVRKGGKWVRYLTSRSLRSELVAFDRGGKFEPGEYTLYAMKPSSRTGKRQGSDKPKKYRKKVRIYHTLTGVRPRGSNI